MRPDGLEAIRAVQTALAEVIAPELQTPFARDTAQMLGMLLESIAGEWDGAAADLRRDNERVATLLSRLRDAVTADDGSAGAFASVVEEIDGVLSEPGDDSVLMTVLAARNQRLNEVLEAGVEQVEKVVSEAGYEWLEPVRGEIYRHLRDVASRGWSFWDMASFREYMVRSRADSADRAGDVG